MRCALLLAAAVFATGAWAQGFRVLSGHGGPIQDVAVSADGRSALTASFDNSVGVWDLASDSVRWLDGHEAAVKAVAFAGPDRAVSAGDDFTIAVWDLTTGTRLRRMTGHSGQIKDLAVSPDGTQLASASWDGTARLWDLATGNPGVVLKGHDGPVNDVAYLDNTTLLTASSDGTIRSWDRATGDQIQVLVRHGFGVTCLLVNARAGWLVYGAVDGGTRVIEMGTGAVLADLTLGRRPVLDIAATPDFSQIAVGDGEGHIMVVDTAGWDIEHDFRAAARGPIWALAYDADGQSLLAGGLDDQAFFWPVGAKADGPILATLPASLDTAEPMDNGERQFRRTCSICHSLADDGIRRAGPSLAGLFGRRAGSYPGYIYSDTVANADIIWNEDTIDALFDLGPAHYIPGTKMPAQRIADPQDRADLIAFLREHTKG